MSYVGVGVREEEALFMCALNTTLGQLAVEE